MGVLPTSQWSFEFRLRNPEGGIVTTRVLPVAATQTIKKGQILALTSGKLGHAIAAANLQDGSPLTSGQNIDSGTISTAVPYFVALQDLTTGASVDETTTLLVAPLDRNQIMLQVGVFGDTATSGAPASSGTAVTSIHAGTAYEIGAYYNASTGIVEYGVDTGTTNGLVLAEDVPSNAAADTFMRGWFWQKLGR